MVRRIIWSENAAIDKMRILEYWYNRIGTKTYSRKLDQQLRQSINFLKNYPEMGRLMEKGNIRFLVKDHYQIFYRFTNDEIRILHIWDSRRNPDELVIEG
jgi:toxin YoeB